jgi:hypothetical protein
MSERLFSYTILPETVEAVSRLLEHKNFFLGDVVEHDMKQSHPLLYEYVKTEAKKHPSSYYYKLGAGVGYCLFGNPIIQRRTPKIADEDIDLLERNKVESYEDFGRDLGWLSEELLCQSGELFYLLSSEIDLRGDSKQKRCVLSGMADAALPFVSKIEAEGFVRRFGLK